MNEQTTKLPVIYWIIAVLALIWNGLGILNFFGQLMMTEEALAAFPEEQQALIQNTPSWIMALFGIAVFCGTLGCVALLIRKSWAVPLFLISLVAAAAQMAYNYLMTDAVSVIGTTFIVTSLLVIVVAGFLYYYARKSKERGWLS